MNINQTDAPRKRPYANLRALLAKNDYSQGELAKHLGCSRAWLCAAMCGTTEWKLDVCYQILDFFRVPHNKLNYYFPKDGKAA